MNVQDNFFFAKPYFHELIETGVYIVKPKFTTFAYLKQGLMMKLKLAAVSDPVPAFLITSQLLYLPYVYSLWSTTPLPAPTQALYNYSRPFSLLVYLLFSRYHCLHSLCRFLKLPCPSPNLFRIIFSWSNPDADRSSFRYFPLPKSEELCRLPCISLYALKKKSS